MFRQSFLVIGCPRLGSKENGQSSTKTAAEQGDASRVWQAATYRRLTMGKSKTIEMRRGLGRPKRSEVFDEEKSKPEV